MSRLKLLTTKFENLRMKEDETVVDFYVHVHDIANCSFSLGEEMSEGKLPRNILISLLKKFDMKVNVIEEAQDISYVKVDELIGSSLTFEMVISDKFENKSKGVSFKAGVEDNKEKKE